jgi:Domain of unknown function (4846)
MLFKPLLFFCLLLSFCCHTATTSLSAKTKNAGTPVANKPDKNPYQTISTIPLPEGYVRTKADSNSFAGWLRHLILKEDKTVYLFNGATKGNQLAQFAVLDIAVGKKDLQQCADAVMRLKADYLFAQKRFDEIVFYDNERGVYTFAPPYTKENYAPFMEKVFGRCGSASLSKQLKTVSDFTTIQPGDVLIRGGFPGHAASVMDVAENAGGKKIFMLAQGYMPAQDIHILVNPADESLSPWYEVNEENKIITPEYLFYKTALKRWGTTP